MVIITVMITVKGSHRMVVVMEALITKLAVMVSEAENVSKDKAAISEKVVNLSDKVANRAAAQDKVANRAAAKDKAANISDKVANRAAAKDKVANISDKVANKAAAPNANHTRIKNRN